MGKGNSSPNINIPNPPKTQQGYKQGVNLYFKYLDRFLNREQREREQNDPQRIAHQQGLQDQFGPTQYRQMLDALRAIDPTGYNLRESTGKSIQANLDGNFTPGQEQAVRRQSAARGNVYGQAAVTGEGSRLWQQALQNAMQFQNSATPESWMQMIPPVSADRSMAYVDPNAGWMGVNAANQQYANQVAAAGAQAQPSSGGGIWSTIGQVAQVAGPILAAFSDRRLKSGIKKVGKMNGFEIFKYKIQEPAREEIGVMAQDVQKTRPDAVIRDPSGYLKVNYEALGLPMPARV